MLIDIEPEKHKHCPEPLVAATGYNQGYIECGFMDLPGLDVTSCSSMPTSLRSTAGPIPNGANFNVLTAGFMLILTVH